MTRQTAFTSSQHSTPLGIAAILLWSTTVAFSRSLTEQLGTLTAAWLIYTAAGVFGLGVAAMRPGSLAAIRSLPRIYLYGCGALFVVYIVALYLAIGTASTRSEVLVVGLINYLWPALSLVFSIPILSRRSRPTLAAGILLALAGIGVSTISSSDISAVSIVQETKSWLPYGLALIAAVSWGLYSNLSRRWAAGHGDGGVPLFLLASGVVLGIIRLFSPETTAWSAGAGIALAYMAIFPGMLAYVFWDFAVRKGEIILLASLSYLTPLLSTIISSLVLNVRPGAMLWIGAGLVILGAVICKKSMYE
jgi:drug/metabolite transporter (DMT)-like permease